MSPSNAPNPFTTPKANVDIEHEVERELGGEVLAERGTRLASALIDGVVAMVVLAPAMFRAYKNGAFSGGQVSPFWWVSADPTGAVFAALWLALMAFQAYLIATGGQSIGKRAMRIQIVRTDGSPAGFVHGVLLHTWALALVSYIPVIGGTIGGLVGLIDALLIFSDERRCLHNRIADTKVIVKQGA